MTTMAPSNGSRRFAFHLAGSWAWCLLFSLLVVLHLPRLALAAATLEDPLASASAIRALPLDDTRPHQVRLEGIVTYVGAADRVLYLLDRTGSIAVNVEQRTDGVSPGVRLRVEGITAEGSFAPTVKAQRLTILGKAVLPDGRALGWSDMLAGREQHQWVRINGIGRTAVPVEGGAELSVATDEGIVRATITHGTPAGLESLIDAKVSLSGVCEVISSERLQVTGFRLLVPGSAHARVEEPSRGNPFNLPVRRVDSLSGRAAALLFGRRVRVQGTVTLARPGRSFFLHDGSAPIFIQAVEKTGLTTGDRVDVVGFFGSYDGLILEDAVFRRAGRGEVRAAKPTTVAAIMKGGFGDELVQLDAVLSDTARYTDEHLYTLLADGTLFYGHLENLTPPVSATPGSRVRVTGVAVLSLDDDGKPDSFKIRMRSANDMVVLQKPSWWTPQRAAWATGAMGLLLLISIASAVVLRQRAKAFALSAETALDRVKILSGLLPMCASCKRIRDDAQRWKPLEVYLRDHSEATLSHGICPDCMKTLYPEFADAGEHERGTTAPGA
jgi:hypothetical protein